MSNIKYFITTSDGNSHQISEDNINKYGIDSYAKSYEGATIRMRNNKGEDYHIPLSNYHDAVSQGLHAFRFDATPDTTGQPANAGSVARQVVAEYEASLRKNPPKQQPYTPQVPNSPAHTTNFEVQSGDYNNPANQWGEKQLSDIENMGRKATPKTARPTTLNITDSRGRVHKMNASPIANEYMPAVPVQDNTELPDRINPNDKRFFSESDVQNSNDNIRERQLNQLDSKANDLGHKAAGEVAKSMREGNPLTDAIIFANTGGAVPSSNPDVITNEDAINAQAISNQVRDARELLQEHRTTNKNPLLRGARGAKSAAKDVRTWDNGAQDLSDTKAILDAAKNYEDGTASSDQQDLLDAAAIKSSLEEDHGDELGGMYGAGKNLVEMAPYMAKFIINPAQDAGEISAKYVAKVGIEKFGKTAMRSLLGKIARTSARVAGDAASAAVITSAFDQGQIMADANKRMTGDIYSEQDQSGTTHYAGRGGQESSAGKAIGKAITNDFEQNFGEMFGEYFSPVGKLLGKGVQKIASKIGLGKVSKMITDASNSEWVKGFDNFEKKAQWHGVLGEYGEEVATNMMNAATVGDNTWDTAPGTGVFNKDLNFDTFLGVALGAGFMSAFKSGQYAVGKYSAKRELNASNSLAGSLIGQDKWQGFKNQIDNADDKDIAGVMNNIVNDENLNDTQKKAAVQYSASLYRYHGANLQDVKSKMEGTITPQDEAFDKGTTLIDPQDRQNAKLSLDAQIENITSLFKDNDPRLLTWLQSDPQSAIQKMKDDGYDENTISIVSNYINTKATYDGMIQGVRDEIDEKVDSNNAVIASVTNQNDGLLHPATMRDGSQMYIVSGNVSLFDDGTIDNNNSDKSIIVRDPSTGEQKMISTNQLESIDQTVNANEYKQQSEDEIRNYYSQQASDQIEGVLPFNPGDTYNILDQDGNTQQVTIQQPVGDGVNVQLLDGSIVPMSEIQSLNNSYNIEKFKSEQPSDSNIIPNFQQGDEIKLNLGGSEVNATISTQQDADGKYEVTLDKSVNGKSVLFMNEDEINSSLVKENQQDQSIPEGQTQPSQQPVDQTNDTIPSQPQPSELTQGKSEEQPDNIVRDEKGLPIYEQSPVEATISDMTKQGADNNDILDYSTSMISELEKESKDLEKKKPEFSKDFSTYRSNKQALADQKAAVEKQKQYWKSVIDSVNTPKEKVQPQEQTSVVPKPQRNTGKYVKENKKMGDYLNLHDRVLRGIATGTKLLWNDSGNKKGLSTELGFKGSEGERKKRIGILASAEKGGVSIDELAHNIWEEREGQPWQNEDVNDIKNEIIDVLSSHNGTRTMIDEAMNMHEQPNNSDDSYEAQNYIHGFANSRHIDPEDVYSFDSYNEEKVKSYDESISDEELSSIFADKNLQENGKESETGSVQGVREPVPTGEGSNGGSTGGGNSLQPEQSITEGSSRQSGGGRTTEGDNVRPEELSNDNVPERSIPRTVSNAEVDNNTLQESPEEANTKRMSDIIERLSDIDSQLIELEDNGVTESPEITSLNSEKSDLESEYKGLQEINNESKRIQERKFTPPTRENEDPIEYAQKVSDAHNRFKEEQKVDTNPSEAQKEAGNYKKGHIKLDGYDITIENPKGSERSGKDSDGKEWHTKMNNTYGYIRGTESVDGDHIDIYLSDDPTKGDVYVVDQVNPETGEFDEHKVMYGFPSALAAKRAYLSNYEKNWKGLGKITKVSKEDFKKWVDSSHRKIKPFSEYKSIKENRPKLIKDAKYDLMNAKRELSVATSKNSPYTESEIEEKRRLVKEAEDRLDELTGKKSEIKEPLVPKESERESIVNKSKEDGTYMKAPNGKNTNLNEDQWVTVRTQSFKDWFGDWENDPKNSSKVVDENGEPLVVYHGTDDRFTEFKPEEIRDREGSFFFAENIEDARGYSGEGNTMPVFVNIKNPFDYEKGSISEEYKDKYNNSKNKREQVEILKKLGYDGFVSDFENGNGWGEISAFYPNQIKSATENNGNFSKDNNDIRFNIKGKEDNQDTQLRDALIEKIRNAGIEVITDKEEMKNTLQESDKGVKLLKTPNGEAYGFVKDGKIYIDTDIAGSDTPIHEYTHLWAEVIRKENPEEWKSIVSLMKDLPMWSDIQKLYTNLKDDDSLAEEVLATYSGQRGSDKLNEEKKKYIQDEHDIFSKAKIADLFNRVKNAIEKFWHRVSDFLNIHYTSAEDVADQALKDLLNEVNPKGDNNLRSTIKDENYQNTENNDLPEDNNFGDQYEDDGKMPLTNRNIGPVLYNMSSEYTRRINKSGVPGMVVHDNKTNFDQAKKDYENIQWLDLYKDELKGILPRCTETAKDRVLRLISEIDRTLDYYKRQAEGEEMWRTEEPPMFSLVRNFAKPLITPQTEFQRRYDEEVSSAANRWRESYQDSMLGLKLLQQQVAKESGEKIDDFENAYMAENQLSSKNRYLTEFYKDNFFTPMMSEVHSLLRQGTSYQDVNDYLIAKHGLERNQYLADKNEEELGIKDYSGLSSLFPESDDYITEAENFISSFEDKYYTADLWNKINKATHETLKRSFEGGLLNKENYDKISEMFKFYVPLRGWDKDVANDYYEYLTSERQIFSPAVKKMNGRTSIADDPLATIGNMAESTILQAGRNLMKQKFLNMAMNHESSLLTVKNMWYVNHGTNENTDWQRDIPEIKPDATADDIHNILEEHENRMKELEQEGKATKNKGRIILKYHTTPREVSEHVVIVKRDGKEYTIFINGNPRAAQAINGLTNPDASNDSFFMKAVKRMNRQMSANFTSRNPAFVVSNLSRDLIFAGTAVAVKEPWKYVRMYGRNITMLAPQLKMWDLLRKSHNGTLSSSVEEERYFKEFLENGGETGYTNLHGTDEYKKMIDRDILESKGKVDLGRIFGLKPGSVTTPTTLGIVPAFRFIAKWTEFLNRSAEDTTRFATYMTSRQMGRSVTRSISDAKEITVNFNKKGGNGHGATFFRSIYLFFNPSIQGLQNVSHIAKNNPIKFSTALFSFTATGFLLPMLNEMLINAFGGGDDKNKYNELPEWQRRNNFVFYCGNNHFVMIPLPIELRAFYGLGEMTYQMKNGNMDDGDAAKSVLAQMSDLMPVNLAGNNGDVLGNIMPDAFKPIYQSAVNVDYFGKPIYRKNEYNTLMPEYTKAYSGTSKQLVKSAKFLNYISGGDEYTPGGINVNPATVEHYFEGYFGGIGVTVNQIGKSISALWDKDMRQTRNIPVLNRLLTTSDNKSNFGTVNEKFYKYMDEYELTKQRERGYKKEDNKGSIEYAKKIDFLENSPEYARMEIIDQYKKWLKGYQDNLKKAQEDNDDATVSDYKNMINETKEEMVNELDKIK